jgi:hypothetical protein
MTAKELAAEIEEHRIYLWEPEYAEYGYTTLYIKDEHGRIIEIPFIEDCHRYNHHLK